MKVSLDFETRSALDLKAVGTAAYTEHASTRVLCAAWAVNDEAPDTWVPSEIMPGRLAALAADAAVLFYAWNVLFEAQVWAHKMVPAGFPPIPLHRWRNTQAAAMLKGLPAGLDGAAAALGLPERKDTEGHRLMLRLSRGDPASPVDMANLQAYCAQDVRTERGVGAAVGELPAREALVYEQDKRINMRGVPLDVVFARLAAKAADDYQGSRTVEMQRRFKINPTQVAAIGAALARMGVPLPDLRAETVDGLLDTPMASFLPQAAVEMLTLRREAAAVSPKKFAAMLRAMSADGRVRGMFQYCGALQTGRWSGKIVQLHNLKRPDLPVDAILSAMQALRDSGGQWGSLLAFGPVLSVLGDCVRPTIAPPGGITKSDASQIEARVLAWLAGEHSVTAAFARGEDVYCLAASGVYGRTITKADTAERQVGKVATLALGYGGGKNAFALMGKAYGVTVDPERAEAIKVAWRASNPAIVQFWADVDAAMHAALDRPGWVGDVGLLRFTARAGTLWCRLPSGRTLAWHGARRVMRAPPWELDKPVAERKLRAVIQYQRPEGKNMVADYTRGAVAVENVTQAVARDLLAEAIIAARGLPLIGHVHDELLAEGAHVDDLHAAMLAPVAWAAGLPRAAETDHKDRYFK